MASRKSQRILLSSNTSPMGKKTTGQKRKADTEPLEISDSEATEEMVPQPSPQKKKGTEKEGQEKVASEKKDKGKQPLVEDQGKKIRKKMKAGRILEDQDLEEEEEIQTTDKAKAKSNTSKHTIPSSWFIDNTTKGMWKDGFASIPISYCSLVDINLLERMNLDCIAKLQKSSIWNMLNPSEKAYPRLTRLFYLNLKQVSGKKMILSSRVGGIDLELNHKVIAEVLGCPSKFKTDDYPPKRDVIRMAKEEFFLPNTPSSKQLTHSVLTVQAKILFTIFVRCVIPKENSRELLSDKYLYLMYLIIHGYEFDLPTIVMEHMLYCSAMKRHNALPYGNLLSLIFEHFKIPVKDEEKISTGFGLITEKTFEHIGVVETKKGKWKLYADLTEKELKAKAFRKPKALTIQPLDSATKDQSQVLKRLDGIDSELEELKQGQFEISTEVKQLHFLMVSMDEKISTILDEISLTKGQHEALHKEQEAKDDKNTADTDNEDSLATDTPIREILMKEKDKKKAIPPIITSEELFEDSGDTAAASKKQDDDKDGEEEKESSDEDTEEGDKTEEDTEDEPTP